MLDKFLIETTPYIVKFAQKINLLIGQFQGQKINRLELRLRKKNLVRTVCGTTKIEGNTLTQKEVSTIIDGKKIIGSKQEVTEVTNTANLYLAINEFNFFNEESFLIAHKKLMKGLIVKPCNAGEYRKVNVRVGEYIAPHFEIVEKQMLDLFKFINENLYGPLITSILAHYFIEVIHPFSDGNGRVGRFWQTVGLVNLHELFEDISVENMISNEQEAYYDNLRRAYSLKNSSPFVEFMLRLICSELEKYSASDFETSHGYWSERINKAKIYFNKDQFSKKEYLKLIGNISTATATNDLLRGVSESMLNPIGEGRVRKYSFIFFS